MLGKASHVFKIDKDIQCQELAGICKRFVERGEDDADNKRYLIEISAQLINELEKTPKDICCIIGYFIEPRYSYGFYFYIKTGTILAVIRGYDVRKTPHDVWVNIWGEEPELLDIPKLNVDGTLKE
jgi:hypothetical protein